MSEAQRPSGRRKSRALNADYGSQRQPRSSRIDTDNSRRSMNASSRSMNSNAAYPSGRKPRGSIVTEGDYPDGRRPRGSIVVEEEVIVEDKLAEEVDEHREKRRRKRIAILAACILTIILVIIIIIILVSVLGTGDGPSNVPIGGVPDNCVANNETKPETYDEYVCDLITTLTTRESTYLRNYAPNTPYGMTIGWMTKEDRTDFENTPREFVMERFVMTLFYFATVSGGNGGNYKQIMKCRSNRIDSPHF